MRHCGVSTRPTACLTQDSFMRIAAIVGLCMLGVAVFVISLSHETSRFVACVLSGKAILACLLVLGLTSQRNLPWALPGWICSFLGLLGLLLVISTILFSVESSVAAFWSGCGIIAMLLSLLLGGLWGGIVLFAGFKS